MHFSTRNRTGSGRGARLIGRNRGTAHRRSAELARATVLAVDAASATRDDIARARAFEHAIHDAQALIGALAAERQRAVRAAHFDGKTLDTIAVQLGTDRDGIQDILDGGRTDGNAPFALSSPARLEH